MKKLFSIEGHGAILSSNAAYADAYLLTYALLQYVINKGVKVFDRTNIQKVNFGRRNIQLKTTNGETISAAKVIYATGYESTEMIKKKIVTLKSTFVTVTESMSDITSFPFHKTLLWNTADPYLYLRTTSDGRVIIGGRDEPYLNPAKRDSQIGAKTKALANDFKKLFPSTAFVPEFSWAGTFGSTRDGLPYVGNYGNVRNRYFALGFGGNGIVFSLIAAELIRDAILQKYNPDAKIFAFDRFR